MLAMTFAMTNESPYTGMVYLKNGVQNFAQIGVERADGTGLREINYRKFLNGPWYNGQQLSHRLDARRGKMFPLGICDSFHVDVADGRALLSVELIYFLDV